MDFVSNDKLHDHYSEDKGLTGKGLKCDYDNFEDIEADFGNILNRFEN